jgi:lipopolysaccharide/colanic/teichoic acid biosynthesis glycosyltransferase
MQFFLLVVPTALFLFLSLFLTLVLWYPDGVSSSQLTVHYSLFAVVFAGWLFALFAFRLFDPWWHKHIRDFVGAFLSAILVSSVFAVIVFYLQPDLLITPRRFLVTVFLIGGVLVFIWLFGFRLFFQRRAKTKVYFFACDPDALGFTAEEQRVNASFDIAGTMTSGEDLLSESLEHVWFVVRKVSTLQEEEKAFLQDAVLKGATVVSVADFYEQYFRRIHLEDVDDQWVLTQVKKMPVFDVMKRLVDVVASLFLCVPFVIILPLVAVLQLFFDRGPVFFLQERQAIGSKTFRIVKFRTMRHGTATDTWTQEGDARITRLGLLLRKTRIDELPQCLNILKGEMSLVGPRPEQVHIVKELQEKIPFYAQRSRVRPGLTGWAQLYVYASTEAETRKKLQYDLYYLKQRSPMFDFEILVKTLIHVLRFAGR